MEQGKTIRRLVRCMPRNRVAHDCSSLQRMTPPQPGKADPEQTFGTGIVSLICIGMWISSQAMVCVLTGSAATILAGMLLASVRLLQEHRSLQPALAKVESSPWLHFHAIRRLRGCPGWRMRDEEYL